MPAIDRDPATLSELLQMRAESAAPEPAYTWLPDSGGSPPYLSYGELDRRARAIAASISEQLAAGRHVALLFPPGLDFITALFGCVYGGFVAVPAYVPRSEADGARLARMLNDAEAGLVLTNSAGAGPIGRWLPAI